MREAEGGQPRAQAHAVMRCVSIGAHGEPPPDAAAAAAALSLSGKEEVLCFAIQRDGLVPNVPSLLVPRCPIVSSSSGRRRRRGGGGNRTYAQLETFPLSLLHRKRSDNAPHISSYLSRYPMERKTRTGSKKWARSPGAVARPER